MRVSAAASPVVFFAYAIPVGTVEKPQIPRHLPGQGSIVNFPHAPVPTPLRLFPIMWDTFRMLHRTPMAAMSLW